MKKRMKHPVPFILIAGMLWGTPIWSQDQKAEHDLAWKMPADHYAVYECFDGVKGTPKGEFCLLPCEVNSRIGSTDTDGLAYRYLFRYFKASLKVGEEVLVKETAFGEGPGGAGVAPLEVAGGFRFKGLKKLKLSEQLRAAFRGQKEKGEPQDLAVVEGQITFARGVMTSGRIGAVESKPSATLSTSVYIRPSDGAIIGGKAIWAGRTEAYDGKLSAPKVSKSTEVVEVLLREPLHELSIKAMKIRIDLAVENGKKWLRAQQSPDGKISDSGYTVGGTAAGCGATALSLLALLHSGVPSSDAGVQKAFSYLDAHRMKEPYDNALYLMAIEGKYLPMAMLDDVANYDEGKTREEIVRQISKDDKARVAQAVAELLAAQLPNGSFGYAAGAEPNLSSTQYALLGLKSASRMGHELAPSVWKRALGYVMSRSIPGLKTPLAFQRYSEAESTMPVAATGWSYNEKYSSMLTGSMTSAGVSSLAICGSELSRTKNLSKTEEQNIIEAAHGGLAWILMNYGWRANTPEGVPPTFAMLYYYIYSVERALILWDVERLGSHSWYLEGAATLLSWQQPDGRWVAGQGTPVVDTAWALLFLKRGAVPVETPERHPVRSEDKTNKLEGGPNEKKEPSSGGADAKEK